MARHLLLRAKFALPPAFLVAASSTDSIRSHPSYHALSDQLITPLIRQLLDAETAHNVAITATSYNLAPFYHPTTTTLSQSAPFPKSPHLKFPSPIGLAAGFDKHATCPRELLSTGFSFVEIGSVTPLPQPGNPKPRVHRLAEDCGVINSYGFNSIGHEAVKANLKANLNSSSSSSSSSRSKIGLIGVNLGKNKTSESPVEDYVLGIKELGQFGDYLVINVSSPNTPGLRGMQSKKVSVIVVFEVWKQLESCWGRPPSFDPPYPLRSSFSAALGFSLAYLTIFGLLRPRSASPPPLHPVRIRS